jgi:hypothetical protein
MNPTAIYSKSGKGVQEAAGKTTLLKRPDRAVLSAIDGRANLKEVAEKVGRTYDAAFQQLIQQLDKEGFIREVTAGAPAAPPSRPMAPPSRPAAPAKPAAMDPGSDLDFSSLGGTKIGGVAPAKPAARPAAPPPAPKPAAPSPQVKAQQSALDKAREEAEAKAAEQRERVRKEAEDKARAELEAKMRADAEKKMKDEAEARAKAEKAAAAAAAAAEAEAKVKAAREAAVRAAAEAKAKADAEAKAKLEAERKVREEMERRLEAERKAREEVERKAKEEAERRAREEAERARKEAEEKARREAEELRQRLEAERKARMEEEAKRQEAERKAEEQARKAKEEHERMRRELEAERQRLEEEKRAAAEATKAAQAAEAAAAAQAAAAAAVAAQAAKAEAPKPPAKPGTFADSLMADLDSFTNKDEEDHKARAEAEARAKAEAQRRLREEAERRAQEEAEARRREEEEARRREEDEARRRDEEQRKAREEEERIAREEERRKREAEEIQRKAEAATAAAMAKQAAAASEEDIPLSEDDLDLDEVKKERKALGIDEKKLREQEKEAERQARKRKRAEEKKRRQAEKEAAKSAAKTVAPSGRPRRARNWGRPIAFLLLLALIVAVGVAHVMPLDVAPYEQAASEALGKPVRIGSARLWLFTGVQLRFDNVRIGDARIVRVMAHPALGSIFGERKVFSLVELDGVSLPQPVFGEALFSRVKSDRLAVERIQVHSLDLPGGLALPKPLDADVMLNAAGALRSATVRGPDGLNVRIVPKGDALDFDATAAGLPLPIGPDVTLSQVAMKGTASRFGIDIAEWGGALFNGGISGTAKMRWGSTWEMDGVVTVRAINAAVFAPALLSNGTAEGTGRFSSSGPDPSKLLAASRVDGRFTVSQGTLGSFDLSRAIQSRGKQVSGTTQFVELNGQGTYDHGTVALRNVTIGAGALNAGASADIGRNGALSGRIVADVRNAGQTLSATLNLAGTVKEPQVRD